MIEAICAKKVSKMRLKWVFIEGVEDGREITLTSVGQQHHDFLTLVFRSFGHLDGGI